MNNPRISIIVAVSDDDVIGASDRLLWKLPDDMARFKRLTTGHTLIMGRKTYESIGKPLPNRITVGVTREPRWRAPVRDQLLWRGDWDAAVETACALECEEVFVAGGGTIYGLALADPRVTRIYLTRVHVQAERVHEAAVKMSGTYFERNAGRIYGLSGDCWVHGRGEFHPADARHAHSFEFVQLDRRPNTPVTT